MSDTNKNYILLSGVNEAGEKQEIVMSIECDIHLIRRNRLGIRAKARIAYGGITISDILIYENRGTIKIEFPTRTETIKGNVVTRTVVFPSDRNLSQKINNIILNEYLKAKSGNDIPTMELFEESQNIESTDTDTTVELEKEKTEEQPETAEETSEEK